VKLTVTFSERCVPFEPRMPLLPPGTESRSVVPGGKLPTPSKARVPGEVWIHVPATGGFRLGWTPPAATGELK
jgi:hypothetical protein